MSRNSNKISVLVHNNSIETPQSSLNQQFHVSSEMRIGSDHVGTVERLITKGFQHHSLARELKRHQITGIAFSAAVGIGLFDSSGEILALGGPVGALIAFVLASLVIFSVMRCLAEMVSVRPVEGALMNFPAMFIEPAAGHAVGMMYWFANCVSMVTLTVAAAVFTQYWQHHLSIASATLILLLGILLLNACGVKLYGNLEWVFKWLKISMILGLCILMIIIKAGGAPKTIESNFELVPGFSSLGYTSRKRSSELPIVRPEIGGVGGQFLAVWMCLTLAMFQFMGGEMVITTVSEAQSPRKDLPTATRYMYLVPMVCYLVGILLVGLCTDYRNKALFHPHTSSQLHSTRQSPFVIAIVEAGIEVLPGFLNACFLFSALTAANSALYNSSRTLFFLARNSGIKAVKNTLGRTNRGQTPLAAILFSIIPGAAAFVSVRYRSAVFKEPLHALGRLYTGPILCVYACECLAFLRFLKGMRVWSEDIDRDSDSYQLKHYRAHWQPLWAIIGLVLCVLLITFGGWNAVYELCTGSHNVSASDSTVDLILIYIGPIMFLVIYITYKISYGSRWRHFDEMGDLWYVRDELKDLEEDDQESRSRLWQFISFIR